MRSGPSGFHHTTECRVAGALCAFALAVCADAAPLLLDPALEVSTAASGFTLPTAMAFLAPNDMLVAEKSTGLVRRVVNGVVQAAPVLDLAVNFNSERGLLGMALAPSFATNPYVYLYWTASSTGADTNVVENVPLLGNRVDRFLWNGSNLVLDQNIAQLRALQADTGQAPRGNHNGGVLRFGPDEKLYIEIGDVGRRGWLQNLPDGPVAGMTDDQFGGPAPDNAHLTGVVLRLNPDGTTPADNPFFAAGAAIGGQAGANIQKVYAYGIRNSFGMAFDPISGDLWMSENGDDAFDELNRVVPAMNGGWVQIMGPVSRIQQYKAIETSFAGGLQQIRWDPSNIAATPTDAMAALYMLPGAAYNDPEFSWKYAVAPAAIGFHEGGALGAQYAGDLFAGASSTVLDGGYLYRFDLDAARDGIDTSLDPRLADLVADNTQRFDGTESESLRFGTGFGVVTDIRTGPNGNLFVTSLTEGAIFEISRAGISPAEIAEPRTLALVALGLFGLAMARRGGFAAYVLRR
jgi:glucose/arabinose dehydrogenase